MDLLFRSCLEGTTYFPSHRLTLPCQQDLGIVIYLHNSLKSLCKQSQAFCRIQQQTHCLLLLPQWNLYSHVRFFETMRHRGVLLCLAKNSWLRQSECCKASFSLRETCKQRNDYFVSLKCVFVFGSTPPPLPSPSHHNNPPPE